jgi:hypothetical protein
MMRSEIARLREQIELELVAMERGMHGLALGTARHAFIQARMERIGEYQDTLASEVGDTTATQIVCNLYVDVMEKELLRL